MKVVHTPLPGVIVIHLQVFGDHRGRFMETYRHERYADHGIDAMFVQDNFSSSARGILRGLHHQINKPQGKLIHVTHGEIFDVAVDVRRGSPTFGQHFGQRISAENGVQMWIPPGFAHGFLVLSEHADVCYKATRFYSPEDERSIRWNDPAIGIEWPLDGEPTLSARDANAKLLNDSDLPDYIR